ncbi:MAG: hypothetical protein H7Y59_04405 [Anaerolineales bacterium]|nr:hypothetical protein [Anaerolineales bacterium]
MKKFNDIEQLSQYIDGQLNSSDSKQLESRIASDPELASDLNEIRAARGILRKLPARKAPRNFTLTRQMVGLKPPLPQSYSFFRFSSAFATVLLVLTFAANSLIPRISSAAQSFSFGMGGGGAPDAAEAPAMEVPAATEAPATELFAATEEPSVAQDTAPAPESLATEESTLKEVPGESADQDQARVQNENQAVIPPLWQIVLLVIGVGSAAIAFMMSQIAKKKWS